MLTSIREKTQGIFAYTIVGLITIPFALWGVSSYFESASKIIVAEVNGEEISEEDYRRALDRIRSRVDPRMLDSPIIKQQITESLVQQFLIRQALDEGGYAVSEQQLGELIRGMKEFQQDGRFDKQRYDAVLRGRGKSISQFEDTVKQEKLIDQIAGSFKDSALVGKTELDKIMNLKAERRRVRIAMIRPSRFIAAIRPTDEEISRYYQDNKNRYQEPEQVRIAYIQLSAKDITKSYRPTEEAIKMAYEEEKGRFTRPGSWRVSHILFELASDASKEAQQKLEKKAQEIAGKARKGGNFAALAKKYSQDPETAKAGGDLGELIPGLLPRELEKAIRRMKKGQISDPIRTEYGYHIAKVTAHRPAKTKPLKSVRSELIKVLRERKGQERYYDMAEQFNNLVYEQPDTLGPAAQTLDLEIFKSPWFSRKGSTGITSNPKVIKAAFSPDMKIERRNSESIEIGQDSLVALRVIGIREARQKSYLEVSGDIARALRHQQAQLQARELGQEIVSTATKGKSLAGITQRHKITLGAPRTINRETEKKLDRRIVGSIFAASHPQGNKPVIGGVDMGPEGYAVFSLIAVRIDKKLSGNTTQRENLRKNLLERRGRDYFYHFLAGLRKQADVKIHTDKI